MATFTEQLEAKWAKGKFVCVGLDPDPEQFPDHLKKHGIEEQLYSFLVDIIDATAGVVAAFKPNIAFFEKFGPMGIAVYEDICHYIKHFHSRPVLICDAKRGDIESTNIGSVEFFFDRCGGDAITIHNYLGQVAAQPFLDRADKGIFVLCKTSNKESSEFQDLHVPVVSKIGKKFVEHGASNVPYQIPLYQYVAGLVNAFWNTNGNCGLVTGATYLEEIKKVREVAPNLPLLIPGVGKQGGRVEDIVPVAFAGNGGFVINSSRNLLYASKGEDFAEAARAKAEELDSQIRALVLMLRSKSAGDNPYR